MGKERKETMRLDKFLGEMGKGTRSQIKEMVRKGRIMVNGMAEKSRNEKSIRKPMKLPWTAAKLHIRPLNTICCTNLRVWFLPQKTAVTRR